MKPIFLSFLFALNTLVCFSQLFGTRENISNSSRGAGQIESVDFDGDGDIDVLTSSFFDNKIAWYENEGGGNFGLEKSITESFLYVDYVRAIDMDGDGDKDILAASTSFYDGNVIAWYENNGSGEFGDQLVISEGVDVNSVCAKDLDGDGDIDVLAASYSEDKIFWFENMGVGSFENYILISSSANQPIFVFSEDLDGDGDMDVIASLGYGDGLVWYENVSGGEFGGANTIDVSGRRVRSMNVRDFDGDGDLDVIVGFNYKYISWYENEGNGNFSEEHIIVSNALEIRSLYTDDIDQDGIVDILYGAAQRNQVVWRKGLENSAGYSYGGLVSSETQWVSKVSLGDIDGDGDLDVLSASAIDDKFA